MTVITRKGRSLKLNQLSVLVVDDQPFYRNLFNELMRGLGIYNTQFAVDGEDALDALDNGIPDIIFTDWLMPEMDGLTLTKKVRRFYSERARMIPIVMITTNSTLSQIQEALSIGVDTFILKPITTQSVLQRMKEVIESPRPFVTTDTYVGPCRRRSKNPFSYHGTYRRFDDPLHLTSTAAAERRAKDNMTVITAKISALITSLAKGNLSTIAPIADATAQVMTIANSSGDVGLGKVCWSLKTYIEKFGTSKHMRVDIIATHLGAMEVLIKTPTADTVIREEVVKGLNTVVLQAIQSIKAA